MPDTTTCHRCGHTVPDLLPNEWEVIEDEGGQPPQEVCPECVAPAEQQAFDEDAMDVIEEISNAREDELSFLAERQGRQLKKSPQRDPMALDHSTYGIYEVHTGGLVAGDRTGYGLSLNDVERYLTRRIEVQDQPVEGTPSLSKYDVPFLAPDTHPETGRGWTLYLLNISDGVETFHIPGPMARDVEDAKVLAYEYMYRNYWSPVPA
jgi:hypothetical protein